MATDNNDATLLQETLNSPLYVSTIDISLAMNSRKTIKSIKLYQSDKLLREVGKTISAGQSHQEEFSQPLLALDPNDNIRVSANCSVSGSKQTEVVIDVDLRDTESTRHEEGIILYRNKARQIEVVVTVHKQSLSAITVQPQFRLLIIGNSGVGKSTLIRKVFGIEDANTGATDIEREFTSPKNKAFVIHTSLGFETGDEHNMEIMKEFVAKRKAMPEIKDQLHAVWLCLEIPYAGGRLLETGVENFLQSRKEIMGDIPLAVVLTKVDLLDGQLEIDLPGDEILEDFKSRYIQEHCVKPLYAAAGNDVKYITVSTLDDYSESLLGLLKATNDNMSEYHVEEIPRATTPAQHRIKEKIELSIGMGKRRYNNMLLKSVFRVLPLKECLKIIHNEIVAIWNINDPDQCLMYDKIIKALPMDNLGDTTTDATATFPDPDGVLGYLFKKKDAKILMAYFVDLICVMKIVSLLVSSDQVTPQVVAVAVKAYEEPRRSVHPAIQKFDVNMAILPGLGCSHVWEKIETLIWRYSITDHEVEELKNMINQAVPTDSSS